jgi:hypothetical protein
MSHMVIGHAFPMSHESLPFLGRGATMSDGHMAHHVGNVMICYSLGSDSESEKEEGNIRSTMSNI